MNIIPFIYNDIALHEACWVDDKPYFTRRAIGEFLEAKNPYTYVRFIVNRNPHIKVFSTRFNLNLVEGQKTVTREVEVYDPIGFQLILMKSNLPKAVQFQIAAAHLVYAFMRGEISPPKNIRTHRLYLECREALKMTPYHDRPVAVQYIAEQSGKPLKTVYGILKRIEQGATSTDRRGCNRKGKHAYLSNDTVKAIERLCIDNPRMTAKEIIQRVPHADCSSKATVCRIKRRIKEQLRQNVIKRLKAASAGLN